MAKKNKIYCVYCGRENVLEDKKCNKCRKKLNPKNRPFRDYMVDKLKGKVSGDIQDNIFSFILEFIKSHLYGFMLTCSIVFTTGVLITNLVNQPNEFETTDTRPNIVSKLEYKGEGLSPEEIVVKYADALNKGDINEIQSYELNTFYPDVFSELKGSQFKKDGVSQFTFLDTNQLFENVAIVFKMERYYDVSIYYGGTIKGKYGNYEFVRHPLYIEYGYPDVVYNSEDDKEEAYAFDYSIEFIKVDDNYYISGTHLDPFISISHEVHYDFFIRNNGDTTKFTYADVLNYIEEIDG